MTAKVAEKKAAPAAKKPAAKKTPAAKKPEVSPDILIMYVIDMSGSMGGMEAAVSDGFNDYIKEQSNMPGKCLVSLTLFDTEFDVRFVAHEAKKLPKMVPFTPLQMQHGEYAGCKNPYFVRGGTALRDAIGISIKGGEEWLKNHPEFTGNVLLTVQTDGYENSSHQFTPSEIRAMIEEKQAKGWTVVFQGGNDAWLQAADFAVAAATTQSFNSNTYAGTVASYTSNSMGTKALRSSGKYDTGGGTGG
jgi:hypothetical protein